MTELVYKDSAKDMTLGSAMMLYKRMNIAVEVNDGKDVTLVIEKEPIRRQAK